MARSREPKAVEVLRDYHDGASVDITFGPTSSQPLARKIGDLFELAGWECSVGNVAQEVAVGYPYREGISVSGVTEHLVVEVVARALQKAGLQDVRTSVVENQIKPSSPKYSYAVRRIYVHVGHLSTAQPVSKRRLTRAAEIAAIVAVPVGALVTWLIAAAVEGWWPF